MQTVLKIAALAAIGSCVATIAFAAPAKPPTGLDAMRATFVKAIAAKDLKTAFALTAFPLQVEEYQAAPRLTLKQVTADGGKFTTLFGDGDKDLLACVGTGPVVLQTDKTQFAAGQWLADCNGNEFYFSRRDGKWLFTAYQNINE
jgi:hypothetical protein